MHRTALSIATLACWFIAAFASPTSAQDQGGDRPTIGLVLSGGSAKGLAHIGAIRVLESRGIFADVVTGTSMGSVVGGLYAIGLPIDSIAHAARSIDWGALMTDAVDRGTRSLAQRFDEQRTLLTLPLDGRTIGLPSGVVRGSRVLRELERLTWSHAPVRDFRDLPRPYRAIATDLESGAAVELEGGVLARAIRASMAIPGAVEPITIDGRLLTDGGLIRNLPAEDARELGADVLICVDVTSELESSEELGTALDVVLQSVFFRSVEVTRQQRALCDVVITPDTEGLSSLDFRSAEEWFARGAAAAEAALDTVALPPGVAGSAAPPLARAVVASDSVRVGDVRVEGVRDPSALRLVRAVLGVEAGAVASRAGLESSLRRLDATELFEHTGYRLDLEGADTVLVVEAEVRTDDEVGLGLRYDTHFDAALLFSGELRNRLAFGSTTELEIRLGQETRLRGAWTAGRGVVSSFVWGFAGKWERGPIDVFNLDATRIAELTVNVLEFRGIAAWEFARGARAGVDGGVRQTEANASTFITPLGSSTRTAFGAVHADIDFVDRRELPRRGVRARARTTWGRSSGDETGWWAQQIAEGDVYVPLSSGFVGRLGAYLGHASGPVPPDRVFAAGGIQRSSVFESTQPLLRGTETQSLLGDAVSIGRAWLRWNPGGSLYFSAGIEGGSVADALFDAESWVWGWGAAATLGSPVGPVRVDVHGGRGDVLVGLALGHRF